MRFTNQNNAKLHIDLQDSKVGCYKYQPISIRKRKPGFKESLHENRIRFKGQRRHLVKLQELGVERRCIAHDFHTHRNTYTDHRTLDSKSEAQKGLLQIAFLF